ncbi:LamG-like jellyroll fold domain-containing protein [Luteimicrobium sp. DT211]|uniref:LamG-like jellyroll fold domain-containing protein n=1 Tax=Luteimicrobium sp. DT211 TaxID=3393412 RepID=UPI003CFAC7A3
MTAIAALVAGAAWAALPDGGDSSSEQPDPDCAAVEAPTMGEASDLAVACGHDVAAVDSYDPWTSLVATPRGTVREEVHAGAVRTDLSGAWQPVDPTIVKDSSTGELTVASPVYDVSLDGDSPDKLISMSSEAGSVSMGLPLALGEPEIDGASVSWPVMDATGSAIEGALVRADVHPDATGVTPVVEVADRRAYDEVSEAAGPGGLAFTVTTSDGLTVAPAESTSAGFEVVDGAGVHVFEGGEALQWDSSGATEPGAMTEPEPIAPTPGVSGPTPSNPMATAAESPAAGLERTAGDTEAPLVVSPQGDQEVTLTPDEAMIGDDSTTWPVAIDPPMSGITRHEWTVIRSGFPTYTKYKTTASEGVGLCDVQADAACNLDNKQRLLWEFTGLSTASFDAADIVSATFKAYGTHSYDCKGYELDLVMMAAGISSGTTWSNGPSAKLNLDTQNPVHRDGQCGAPSWVSWDATAGAKAIAGSSNNMILELRSPSESSMSSWRRYKLYNATLAIEYNRAPTAPSSMKTLVGATNEGCETGTGRPLITSTTPSLSVVAKDPDGQNVAVTFEVYKGDTLAWSATTSAQASGATHTKAVPSGELASSSTYKWRARGKDNESGAARYSSWAGWCEFTVDTTKPAAPTITPVEPTGANSSIRAVYVPDVERGGVGQKGCFKISRGSSTDVDHFEYSFNTTTYGTSVTPASDGTAQVCTPAGAPTAAGTNRLYARSEDKAGNVSASRTYTYEVATAREDGIWNFDTKANPVPDTSRKDTGEANPAGDLTVSGATWVTGPHTLFDSRDGDWALNFDGVNDEAFTESPVFDTTQSFVVSAHLRLDEATKWHTAIIQEGAWKNAWRLGYRPNGCEAYEPAGWTGGCWLFVMYATEGGAWKAVYSPVPPKVGQWTHLTAEFDKTEKKVRLWTCDIGTPDDPAPGEPVVAEAPSPDPMWRAAGPVVLGRGQIDGAKENWWDGQIDNVRIFKNEVVAPAKIRRMCQGAEANDFSTGDTALDPTTMGGL